MFFEKKDRIDRICGEKIAAESLIHEGDRIDSFPAIQEIVGVILIGDIDLEVQMISIGISGISDFSDRRSSLDDVSFIYEDFRKMGVI